MTTTTLLVLALTSLGAATVNGALGYGYSSISVPIALLVVAGRVLNPALVIVEVAINAVRAVLEPPRRRARARPRCPARARARARRDRRRAAARPRRAGERQARARSSVLLPLILIQASGRRWPIRASARAAVPLGAGVGLLYGLTTISRPAARAVLEQPGAREGRLQGRARGRAHDRDRVRADRVRVRSACSRRESAGPAAVHRAGRADRLAARPRLVRRVGAETFRRVCMSFDAYLVAFGLARTLIDTGVAPARRVPAARRDVDRRQQPAVQLLPRARAGA